MRHRLLQLACLLIFGATSLPGSAGLHWLLGLEHHHAQQATAAVQKSVEAHQHAGCKHHHHHASDESLPTHDSRHSSDDCSLCDFFSRPLSNAVAMFEVSVDVAPISVPLATEVVLSVDPLATPPARGPPSLS